MKYEKIPSSIYEEYPDVYAFGDEYAVEDELFCRETEAALSALFEELDALILDHLPASLVTTPAEIIRAEFERKTGLYLTRQEIVDAYLRFAGGCYE